MKLTKKVNIVEDYEKHFLDTDLGTFFECVNVRDRKKWLANEIYASTKLNISTLG